MTRAYQEFLGIDATPLLLRELRAAKASGVLLRRRNVESPEQVKDLAEALRKELGPSLDIAVRHEGGVETPFVRGVTFFPDLAALQAAGRPELAREVGRAMGRELGAMGISTNLLGSNGPVAAALSEGFAEGVASGEEPEEADAEALAVEVAEAALRIVADPGKLLPIPQGRRVGLLVPRLGDVADRLAVETGLRATAALLRPRVGASVAVLETPLQADARTAALAAEWAAAQDTTVAFSLDPQRFPGQRRLLDALGACRRRVIVALAPGDDGSAGGPEATLIRTQGFQRVQLLAAMRTIFALPTADGKRKPRPPVSLV